jgi:hypothetical protein
MCPICIASSALIAGCIATTGGLAAMVLKKAVAGKSANNIPNSPPKEDDHGKR